MKILLPSETQVEATYKELKQFLGYLDLVNEQDKFTRVQIKWWLRTYRSSFIQGLGKANHRISKQFTINENGLRHVVTNSRFKKILQEYLSLIEE